PVHQGTHFDLQRHHRSPDWRHGGDLDPLVDNNNEYIHLELFAQVQANTTDVLDRMPLYWLCYRHNNQISVVIEPGASLIHAGRSRSFLIAFTSHLLDSLHDWHLKILLVAAKIRHLAHIFFQGL